MAAIFKPLRGSRFRAARGASCAAQCVFSVLVPLSNSYSVLIPVLIPVLIHGFAGRATRNKLSVNRFKQSKNILSFFLRLTESLVLVALPATS